MSTFNMDNQGLSRIILDKIKTKQITPKPRWTFLLKNYLVWFLAFLSLFVGSMSAAVIIMLLRHSDWEIIGQTSGGLPNFILSTLPFFWIILLFLLIIVGLYNFRHTKKGYRYRVSLILAATIILSVVFGEVLYRVGISQAIDDTLGANIPMYRRVMNPRINFWSETRQGRLAGVIISMSEDSEFTLLDQFEKIWLVYAAQNAWPRTIALPAPGDQVKILGEEIGLSVFSAWRILPFGQPGRGFFGEKFKNQRQNKPNMPPRHFYSQPEIPIK